jgi:hypothetical protein
MYHRRWNGTSQTNGIADLQAASGEAWGYPTRYGREPVVQAHDGPLPAGMAGIEFETDVDPDHGSAPGWPRWTRHNRSGRIVERRDANGNDYAALPIRVTRIVYSPTGP